MCLCVCACKRACVFVCSHMVFSLKGLHVVTECAAVPRHVQALVQLGVMEKQLQLLTTVKAELLSEVDRRTARTSCAKQGLE